MKNVEIVTAQNVVLQYELASIQDRIFAFLIDLFILVVGTSIIDAILTGILGDSGDGNVVVEFIVISIFIFYSLAFEVFNNGKSLGKMAMKIQVIKLAGSTAGFTDYAARWAFRLIDIYFSLGSLASILILSSSKAQRIGDLVANTTVIKTIPRTNIDLNDLLSIHQVNKYIPKYQQARKLREQDALLIKSALERYRQFRNKDHKEALVLLANHISETLGITETEEESTQFLQTVLKDYVVLSR